MRRIRCAIYTRKSSEDGLEQDFNSLDAQREACEAYVASQRHEGWELLPDHYDNGGISGGHLDRPGLQHLMEAVDAKQVDQIVVYKIDRLTRSLADFAKLVDRLGFLCLCDPKLQHLNQHGAADAQCAAELCAVRARGDRRAHSGQNRGIQAQRSLDGRERPDGL